MDASIQQFLLLELTFLIKKISLPNVAYLNCSPICLFQFFPREIRDLAVMRILPINTRLKSLTICTVKKKTFKIFFSTTTPKG